MGLPATAARIMEGVMSLAAFGTGVRLGIHSRATAALNERERSFLLVGRCWS
ncbi:hypothetical protein RAA17_03380 [Komagataeibacter rhaeticus]|nr:hypothetical protein [Komagataeibacter rhaeticus]